jgi:asparagine synthase (glutamine-hydrolysing)
MCGICGFTNYKNDDLLKDMVSNLIHRGPDDEGSFIDGDKVSLAMRRLSIIDIDNGAQPIFNEDKSIVIVFNGEIYNFKELRDELRAKGHSFRTQSDTEVIVHLYEEYGEDAPKYLRGMFAFSLWDKKLNKLLIARDHVGVKPLFYSQKGKSLFFASEIKSILKNSEISTNMDYSSLDAYLKLLYIPSPLTIFKDIKKLEPGHILVWMNGSFEIKKYWSVPDEAIETDLTEEYCVEQIKDLLGKSVEEQKIADVPIGVLLSGGIDSSALTHFLSLNSNSRIKTFSIAYSEKEFNESEKARLISKKYNTEHFEAVLKPDIENLLENIVGSFDEPFADSSAIPNYLISKYAGEKVKVALTGIGGDEIFAGYPRHMGARVLSNYLKVPGSLRKMMANLSGGFSESTSSSNTPQRLKRFFKGGEYDFPAAYNHWTSYLTEDERRQLYAENSKAVPGFADKFSINVKSEADIFKHEISNYLPEDLLYLSDRMSMANSLEMRVPFLDIRLIEFMSKIPLKFKTKGFTLKYLLKKSMENLLPNEILNQKKMGFQVPLAKWINSDLKEMIGEYLSPERIKKDGFFNPDFVDSLRETHKSGKRNLYDQIYSILIFNMWFEKMRKINGR